MDLWRPRAVELARLIRSDSRVESIEPRGWRYLRLGHGEISIKGAAVLGIIGLVGQSL